MNTRHGIARTMEALDYECAGLARELNGAMDASQEGMPLPVILDSLHAVAIISRRIASIASAQANQLDETLLQAAE